MLDSKIKKYDSDLLGWRSYMLDWHVSKLVDLIQKRKYNNNFLGWRSHMFDRHISKIVVLVQKHIYHNDLLGWRSYMLDWHTSELWIYSHCWTVGVNLSASIVCPYETCSSKLIVVVFKVKVLWSEIRTLMLLLLIIMIFIIVSIIISQVCHCSHFCRVLWMKFKHRLYHVLHLGCFKLVCGVGNHC